MAKRRAHSTTAHVSRSAAWSPRGPADSSSRLPPGDPHRISSGSGGTPRPRPSGTSEGRCNDRPTRVASILRAERRVRAGRGRAAAERRDIPPLRGKRRGTERRRPAPSCHAATSVARCPSRRETSGHCLQPSQAQGFDSLQLHASLHCPGPQPAPLAPDIGRGGSVVGGQHLGFDRRVCVAVLQMHGDHVTRSSATAMSPQYAAV